MHESPSTLIQEAEDIALFGETSHRQRAHSSLFWSCPQSFATPNMALDRYIYGRKKRPGPALSRGNLNGPSSDCKGRCPNRVLISRTKWDQYLRCFGQKYRIFWP